MCSTARGSITGLSLVGPTKVKARKPFLFTKSYLKVENKEYLVDFFVTFYFTSLFSNALHSSKVLQAVVLPISPTLLVKQNYISP